MPDEIKEVLQKLSDMHVDIKLCRAELKEVRSDVETHEKALFGNGQEGLKIRVTRIETATKTVHKVWGGIATALAGLSAWMGLHD